jgi:hypothetical protein
VPGLVWELEKNGFAVVANVSRFKIEGKEFGGDSGV